MKTRINIWYDQEGDFLEIGIGTLASSYAEIDDDGIIIWRDRNMSLITGIGIINLTKHPTPMELPLHGLDILYNKQDDTLKICLGAREDGTYADFGNDMLKQIDNEGRIIGLIINNITRRSDKFINFDLSLPYELRVVEEHKEKAAA